MKTIQASVNPRLLSKASRLFTGTLEGRVIEILQNARRAGATQVAITNQDGVVTVRDNGHGIKDFTRLIDLGSSGWEEQIENSEDPAGVGIFCLSPREVTVRSRGQRAIIANDGWSGAPIPIEHDEQLDGTELRFKDEIWGAGLVEPLAVFTGMEVVVDGHVCARHDFLSPSASIHAILGCRIEVCEHNGLSTWHRAPNRSIYDWNVLLNFHGQLVGFTHHPVEEHGLRFLIDMTGEPTGIRLMLPARTQLVENEAFSHLMSALEWEAFQHIKRRGNHTLPFKQYRRAQELGIALPEATPTFNVGLIGGGDPPEPIDVTMPEGFPLSRCYRMSQALADSQDYAETNTHLLAALGTFKAPFVPVSIRACYDGYSWARLPTIDQIALKVGKQLHAGYVWSGQIICVKELFLTAHASDGNVISSPVCMAIDAQPTEKGLSWGSEDVRVTPEANERLLASQIWHHLGGWNDEGDTYDTQEYQFEQELNRFWAELIGPDEHLRRQLVDALIVVKEKWRSVTITASGMVSITSPRGKTRTIKPVSLPK